MDILRNPHNGGYMDWPEILLTEQARSVSEGQASVGVTVTLDLIHPDVISAKYDSGKYKCGELEGVDHIAYTGDIVEITKVNGQLCFCVKIDHERAISFKEEDIVEIDNYYITIYKKPKPYNR